MRDALREAEGRVELAALNVARKAEAEDVVTVPREEWDRWFEPPGGG
jgi:hypothetical protein